MSLHTEGRGVGGPRQCHQLSHEGGLKYAKSIMFYFNGPLFSSKGRKNFITKCTGASKQRQGLTCKVRLTEKHS